VQIQVCARLHDLRRMRDVALKPLFSTTISGVRHLPITFTPAD
jgi:hypothetical protein